MPHLIIDYSADLDADLDMMMLARTLHDTAISTGVFPIGGCRTRLARREFYVIGDGHPENRYIHVQARIGSGRTPEIREKVADTIFDALIAATSDVFARRPLGLSFEIVEMETVGSRKHNNLHEIIAARQAGQAKGEKS